VVTRRRWSGWWVCWEGGIREYRKSEDEKRAWKKGEGGPGSSERVALEWRVERGERGKRLRDGLAILEAPSRWGDGGVRVT